MAVNDTQRKIQAVIVDLDRTLLHTDKSLSSRSIHALNMCRKMGIKIMVATARPYRCILEYCEKFPFDAYTVTNGAIIICGQEKIDYQISRTSAQKMLEALCIVPGLLISVEMGNDVYSNLPIPDYESTIYHQFPSIPPGEGIYKILVNLEDTAVLSCIEKNLPDDLYYTISGGHLIQIMSVKARKWHGIQTMLEFSGINPENAMYFGDDQDDIEPLKYCGVGVAVANAIPQAWVAADLLAASNDQDGVADFLENYFHFHYEEENK